MDVFDCDVNNKNIWHNQTCDNVQDCESECAQKVKEQDPTAKGACIRVEKRNMSHCFVSNYSHLDITTRHIELNVTRACVFKGKMIFVTKPFNQHNRKTEKLDA